MLLAVVALCFVACGKNPQPDDNTQEITEKANEYLNKIAITYASGDSATSVTKDVTLGTATAEGLTVTWASNNAAITKDGKVTQGDADVNVKLTVTIKYQDVTLTKDFNLVVKAKAAEVEPVAVETTTEARVLIGGSYDIVAAVKPDNATAKELEYASDNTAVATVDASGKVTGVAAGTAKITVSVKGYAAVKAEITVTVAEPDADTIAATLAKEKGAQGWIKGTVVGTYKRGFMVYDGTGYILVYMNNTEFTQAIGDFVEVKGELGEYNGAKQFTDSCTLTALTEGTPYKLSAATLDDAGVKALIASFEYAKKIKVRVTIDSASDSYVNATVKDGESGIAITYPLDKDAYEVGADYDVTGLALYTKEYNGKTSVYLMVEKASKVDYGFEVTITYKDGDATDTVKINSLQFPVLELKEPAEKAGYVFRGWYKGSLEAPVKVTSLLLPEDIELFAIWVLEADAPLVVNPDAEEGSGQYKTIAAAIAAATEGQTIELLAGDYVETVIIPADPAVEGSQDEEVEKLVIDKKVTIIGPNSNVNGHSDERADEAVIKVPTTISANGVVIDGLKFEANGCIGLGANDVVIKNCYIDTDKYLKCDNDNRQGQIANVGCPENAVIANNYFLAAGTSYTTECIAIGGTGAKNLTITGNYFESEATTAAIYECIIMYRILGELIITNNEFHYACSGYVMRNNLYSGGNLTYVLVQDNVFDGCGEAGGKFAFQVMVDAGVTYDIIHNQFLNCAVETVQMKGTCPTNTVNFLYNYKSDQTEWKWVGSSYKLNFDYNCILGANAAESAVDPATQAHKFDTLEALEEAYKAFKAEQDRTATVTFNTDGGNTIDPIVFKNPAKVVLPTPEKAGYEFAGWYGAAKLYADKDAVAAAFLADYNAKNGRSLTAAELDSSTSESSWLVAVMQDAELKAKWMWLYKALFTIGGGAEAADPEAAGQDFSAFEVKGFYLTNLCGFFTGTQHTDGAFGTSFDWTNADAVAKVMAKVPAGTELGEKVEALTEKEDITLTAKWLKINKITFDANGGTAVEAIEFTDFSKVTLPRTTKEGEAFVGWAENGALIEAITENRDYNLVAVFGTPKTLTLDVDGGEAIEPIVYYDFAQVVLPTPVKSGYRFMGWYNGETKVEALTENADLTLKAAWVKTYTITFDTDGGAAIDPIEFVEVSEITALPKAVKENAIFKGWKDGENDAAVTEQKDYTFKAVYDDLAAAVAALAEGDILELSATTYTSEAALTISVNNVTIKGNGAILSGIKLELADGVKGFTLDGVTLTGLSHFVGLGVNENITMKNCVINNIGTLPTGDGTSDGVVYFAEVKNFVVTNNIISGTDASARIFRFKRVENLTFTNNKFDDTFVGYVADGGDLIRVDTADGNYAKGLVYIADNEFRNASQVAIHIRPFNDLTLVVTNNYFKDCVGGFWLRNFTGTNNIIITNNYFTGCGKGGWDVIGGNGGFTKALIKYNYFDTTEPGATAYHIALAGPGVTAEDNYYGVTPKLKLNGAEVSAETVDTLADVNEVAFLGNGYSAWMLGGVNHKYYNTFEAACAALDADSKLVLLPGQYKGEITKALNVTSVYEGLAVADYKDLYASAAAPAITGQVNFKSVGAPKLSYVAITGEGQVYTTGVDIKKKALVFDNLYAHDSTFTPVEYKANGIMNVGSDSLATKVAVIQVQGVYHWSSGKLTNCIFEDINGGAFFCVVCNEGFDFDNCEFTRVAYDAITFRYSSGTGGTFNVTNCKFDTIGANGFYVRSVCGTYAGELNALFSNCSFNNCAYNAANLPVDNCNYGCIASRGYSENKNVKVDIIGCHFGKSAGYINLRDNVTKTEDWIPKGFTYVTTIKYCSFEVAADGTNISRSFAGSDSAATNKGDFLFDNNYYYVVTDGAQVAATPTYDAKLEASNATVYATAAELQAAYEAYLASLAPAGGEGGAA